MDEGIATRSAQKLRARFRAVATPWPRKLGWRGADILFWLRNNLEAELAERAGFNWLAVAFAIGSLCYFALPREPLLIALFGGAVAFAVVASVAYRRGTAWRIVTVIAVLLAGATAGKVRVDGLVVPEIERPIVANVSGRVIDREGRAERRPRIVLDEVRSAQIAPEAMPQRIRVTLSEKYGLPPLGGRIVLKAGLAPVEGAVVPGGYDPHRAAFFDAIGGSGFVLGQWTREEDPPAYSPDLMVERTRAAIVQRIMAAEPGEAGAVAAALLVGERSALSSETNDNLRISGLYHILSISGLHMMLIAGVTFFAVRGLLALSPSLALRRPIRKWAAAVALVVLSAYFALSGGGPATVRSYVMALIIFGAILIDRPAISMRNLAIAAFVVLAFTPEGVVEPGFQMSFAAVAALIATWEFWRTHRAERLTDDNVVPGFWLIRLGAKAVGGVAVTTLVAGLATSPFAAYHFERVATYSLLGNLLAAPLVSVIIMPFGLLSLVVMPFGLEALPLAVMAWGIDMLLGVARFVASIPGAQVHAPPIAPLCLLLIASGMVWLCLWRRRWRLFGLAPIALGLALIPALVDPPDILVAPSGTAIAVRDAAGVLRVSGARAGTYVVGQFFDEEGEAPSDMEVLRLGVSCDAAACLLHDRGGDMVSHVRDPSAFAEDCGRAAVVATPLAAPRDCTAPLVIDARHLARFGAHAVWIGEEGGKPSFRVTTDRSSTPRPWQASANPLP